MASVADRPGLPLRTAPGTARGRRTSILLACALAGAAAWIVGDPRPRLQADPETAQLLRSMALVKAMFLAPALALVLWRVRSALSAPLLLGYGLCVTAMTAATVLVFQLSHLAVTSFVFHFCLIALLVLAWRDDGVAKGPLAKA